MPNGLSYQSLRSVLEYLEANSRIYISCRCPFLRKIEKTIPLHLDNLVLGDYRIILNKISFGIQTVIKTDGENEDTETLFHSVNDFGMQNTSELLPGDIRLEGNNHWAEIDDDELFIRYVEIRFKYSGNHERAAWHWTGCERRIPNTEFHVAMKTLAGFLLGGRREIRVKKLKIEHYWEKILRLPLNLKIQVDQILNIRKDHFEAISHLIDASRPLKKLKIEIGRQNCLQNPILQTSEKLILHCFQYFDATFLFNLPNKEVELQNTVLLEEDFVTLIRHWVDTGRDIGTCYKFDCSGREFVEVLLDAVKQQLNGVSVQLKEHDKKSQTSLQCVSIPMNSTSELLIYGTDDGSVQMEVRQIGSTTPIIEEPELSFIEHLNEPAIDDLPTNFQLLDVSINIIVIFLFAFVSIIVASILIELLE